MKKIIILISVVILGTITFFVVKNFISEPKPIAVETTVEETIVVPTEPVIPDLTESITFLNYNVMTENNDMYLVIDTTLINTLDDEYKPYITLVQKDSSGQVSYVRNLWPYFRKDNNCANVENVVDVVSCEVIFALDAEGEYSLNVHNTYEEFLNAEAPFYVTKMEIKNNTVTIK